MDKESIRDVLQDWTDVIFDDEESKAMFIDAFIREDEEDDIILTSVEWNSAIMCIHYYENKVSELTCICIGGWFDYLKELKELKK